METTFRVLGGHLWALGNVAFFALLAFWAGRLLLSRLNLHFVANAEALPRVEYLLLQVGVGFGVLSTLPFLLSTFRCLTPNGVRVALFLLALLLWFLPHALRRDPLPASASASPSMPRWAVALGAVLLICFLGVASACLTPMVDYDGLAYHVGAPKRWLALGGLDYLPTHLHTQWTLGVEMLNLLLLPLGGDAACKPLIALFAALTLTATYALGARLVSRQVGLVAAAIVLLRMGAPSINTTSVEVPLTFYVLLCAFALVNGTQALGALDRRRWLLVAGACAGIACCVKLNGLLCLLFLVGAWLCLTRAHRGGLPLKAQASEVLRFVGIALLCASPWYLRSLFQTGNPLYPFVFGGRGWDAEGTQVLTAYFHTFDLPGKDYAARHAFVLRHLVKVSVFLGVALVLPSPRWLRGLVAGAALFAFLQIWTSDNPRFLLPVAPFAALMVGWWAAQLGKWVPFVAWGIPLLFGGLALPAAWGQLRGAFPLIVGTVSRDASLARYVNNREAFEWVNHNLPPDAKILYAPDNRTYFLERHVYWSSAVFQRRIRYETAAAFWESLRREGIEYLIINTDVYKDSAIDFETRTGWREAEYQRLQEAGKRAVTLWNGRGVVVYRLVFERKSLRSQ